ncbi:hypothetical protein DYB34_013660, partial [Aphanomyces astaci]
MAKGKENAATKQGIILYDPDEYTRTTGHQVARRVQPAQALKGPVPMPMLTGQDLKPRGIRNRRGSLVSFRRIQAVPASLEPPATLALHNNLQINAVRDHQRISLANTMLVHEDIPMLEETPDEEMPSRKSWRLRKLWRKY